MKFKYLFGSFILLFTHCISDYNCEIKNAKFMGSHRLINVGADTSYGHDVLLEGYKRECVDSLTIINIFTEYIDTITVDKPVWRVLFFSSDETYNYHDPCIPIESYRDFLIIRISLNKFTPDLSFAFYGDNREVLYYGKSFSEGKEILIEYLENK